MSHKKPIPKVSKHSNPSTNNLNPILKYCHLKPFIISLLLITALYESIDGLSAKINQVWDKARPTIIPGIISKINPIKTKTKTNRYANIELPKLLLKLKN